MPTIDEIRDEARDVRRGIEAWSFPAGFLAGLRSDDQRAHWRGLLERVKRDAAQNLDVVDEALSVSAPERADDVLSSVERVWVRWLRQVQQASRDPLVTPTSRVQRTYDATNEGITDAERRWDDLVNGASDAGRMLAVGAVAVVVMLALSRRR